MALFLIPIQSTQKFSKLKFGLRLVVVLVVVLELVVVLMLLLRLDYRFGFKPNLNQKQNLKPTNFLLLTRRLGG